MDNFLLLAKVIGPLLLIVGLGIFINPKFYQKVMNNFVENEALTYIGGLLAYIVGVLIIINHNIWELRPAVIITIFGWGGIIKAFFLLVFPEIMKTVTKKCISQNLLPYQGAFIFILGAILTAGACTDIITL